MDGPSNLLMGMSYYIHLYRRLAPDRGGKSRQTGRMAKENAGPISRPEENA